MNEEYKKENINLIKKHYYEIYLPLLEEFKEESRYK